MNHCRTCKYWMVIASSIGVGMCQNHNVSIRLPMHASNHTAQDFGCPFHEHGPYPEGIFSKPEELTMLKDFVRERHCKSIL